MAILCNKMGIDYWEVVDAAKTKPMVSKPFIRDRDLEDIAFHLDPYYLSGKLVNMGFIHL